ncbi:MAG: cupin domain-containing protein [Candidatus Bathyarchaeia archaeon]
MEISLREKVRPFNILPKVIGRVLLSGKNIMIILVEIEPNGIIPEHSHPNEQMGICLKGRAEFKSDGKRQIVNPGTVYYFPSNEKHSVELIGEETGVFLDIFSPPREDYIRKQNEVERL